MLCDKNIYNEEYTDVFNVISQVLCKYNPSHIVIGGYFNVHFSRSSLYTHILSAFITDFNIYI